MGLLFAVFLFFSPLRAGEAPSRVSFQTEDGWKLSGFYRAPRKGKPVAVLIHGVASGKEEWGRLLEAIHSLGLGSLSLDLRGHGESLEGPEGRRDYGDFDRTGEWPRAERDLEAGLAFLRRRGISNSRVALVGASIGANLASRTAASHREIRWLVLLSPGFDYRGVRVSSELPGKRVFLGASAADPYAYRTALTLIPRIQGCRFLQAGRGHGVGMFEDPEFLRGLLAWMKGVAR